MQERYDGFCGMDFETWLRSLTNEERDILAEHMVVDLIYSDGGEVFYSQCHGGRMLPMLSGASDLSVIGLASVKSCGVTLVSRDVKETLRKRTLGQPHNRNACYMTND